MRGSGLGGVVFCKAQPDTGGRGGAGEWSSYPSKCVCECCHKLLSFLFPFRAPYIFAEAEKKETDTSTINQGLNVETKEEEDARSQDTNMATTHNKHRRMGMERELLRLCRVIPLLKGLTPFLSVLLVIGQF